MLWFRQLIADLSTVVARVQSQVRSCGICGGQSSTGTDLSPSISVVSSQYQYPPVLSIVSSVTDSVLSQELTLSLIRHQNQWGNELPNVVHACEWMGKLRNTDPNVEQREASGNNDGTEWSETWRLDNVFDIVTRFRTRRPIGSIPDGGRKRFSSPACPDWFSVPANPLVSGYQGLIPQGCSGRDVKLTARLYLGSRLRM